MSCWITVYSVGTCMEDALDRMGSNETLGSEAQAEAFLDDTRERFNAPDASPESFRIYRFTREIDAADIEWYDKDDLEEDELLKYACEPGDEVDEPDTQEVTS